MAVHFLFFPPSLSLPVRKSVWIVAQGKENEKGLPVGATFSVIFLFSFLSAILCCFFVFCFVLLMSHFLGSGFVGKEVNLGVGKRKVRSPFGRELGRGLGVELWRIPWCLSFADFPTLLGRHDRSFDGAQ
jgi:hypothetical protein